MTLSSATSLYEAVVRGLLSLSKYRFSLFNCRGCTSTSTFSFLTVEAVVNWSASIGSIEFFLGSLLMFRLGVTVVAFLKSRLDLLANTCWLLLPGYFFVSLSWLSAAGCLTGCSGCLAMICAGFFCSEDLDGGGIFSFATLDGLEP